MNKEQKTVVAIQELPELPPEEKPARTRRVKRTFGKQKPRRRLAAGTPGRIGLARLGL